MSIPQETDRYEVRSYPGARALFCTGISTNEYCRLLADWSKDGMTGLYPGIAENLGAHSVAATKEVGEKWMKELSKSPDWLRSGDTGSSSRTIYAVLANNPRAIDRMGPSIPYDPDDFGRCYRLLKRFPEWTSRLGEVADRYPDWKPLVCKWAEMTQLYERDFKTGRCAELYSLMQQLNSVGRGRTKAAT